MGNDTRGKCDNIENYANKQRFLLTDLLLKQIKYIIILIAEQKKMTDLEICHPPSHLKFPLWLLVRCFYFTCLCTFIVLDESLFCKLRRVTSVLFLTTCYLIYIIVKYETRYSFRVGVYYRRIYYNIDKYIDVFLSTIYDSYVQQEIL